MIRAVELDGSCDQTRRRLLGEIIHQVWFSTHHLPDGYLGDPSEDLELLGIAERQAQFLKGVEERENFLCEIQAQRRAIEDYEEGRCGGRE